MSIRPPYGIAARPARLAAKVTVAVIAGPDAPLVATLEDLRRWRRLTPLALWSAVSIRGVPSDENLPDEILRGTAAELVRRDIEAHRLILLAEGQAGRAALELVLRGEIDCAGLLAIAVPARRCRFASSPPPLPSGLSCVARIAGTRRSISSPRCALPTSTRGSWGSIRPQRKTREPRQCSRNLCPGAGRKCQPPKPPLWSVKRCRPERLFSSSARFS